jgi:hypothetical protein
MDFLILSSFFFGDLQLFLYYAACLFCGLLIVVFQLLGILMFY